MISRENHAATVIQRNTRNYLSRLHFFNKLCKNVYEMPRAPAGHTNVYLPESHPGIVIKATGPAEGKERLEIMRRVRAIIESLGAKNLFVPTATLCGRRKEYLVERRERINIVREHNEKLYLNEPRLFDNLVRQITALFSRAYLRGLVDDFYLDHHFKRIRYPSIRFDNFPLIIRKIDGKREGCVSFIDPAWFILDPNERNKKAAISDLIDIFPLHFEQIKADAAKMGIPCEPRTYLGHYCWLEPLNPNASVWLAQKRDYHFAYMQKHKLLELTPERKERLVKMVEKNLMEWHWEATVHDKYTKHLSHKGYTPETEADVYPRFEEFKTDLAVAKQFAPQFVTQVFEKMQQLIEAPTQVQKEEAGAFAAIAPALAKLKIEKNFHRYVEFKDEALFEDLNAFIAANETVQTAGWSKMYKLSSNIAYNWILPALDGREIFTNNGDGVLGTHRIYY